MASLVCSLIDARRITTTLAKAREARKLAEKMVTLAGKDTLAARRRVMTVLKQDRRVATLFSEIAPAFKDRPGGYTRIIKKGQRRSDGSEMAILEWVDLDVPDRTRKTEKSAQE